MGRNEKRFCKKPPPPYFLILNGVARGKIRGLHCFYKTSQCVYCGGLACPANHQCECVYCGGLACPENHQWVCVICGGFSMPSEPPMGMCQLWWI